MILQRTPEWFSARCGKPSGSQAWRIMAVKKDGSASAERQSYMIELLAERMTGSVADRFCTQDMQRGIDMEGAAIRAYETMTGRLTEPGYWVDCGTWGCTPDAFVEDEGLLSVKCPRTTTIIRQRYFETDIPPEYYWQALSEMVATGRQWCDLIRYDDRFASVADHAWIVRIPYNPDDGARLRDEFARFNADIDALLTPGATGTAPGAGHDVPADVEIERQGPIRAHDRQRDHAGILQNVGVTSPPPAAAPDAPLSPQVERPAGTSLWSGVARKDKGHPYPLTLPGGRVRYHATVGEWAEALADLGDASDAPAEVWTANLTTHTWLVQRRPVYAGHLQAVQDHFAALHEAARLARGIGA